MIGFGFATSPTKSGPLVAIAQGELGCFIGENSQPCGAVLIHFVHGFEPDQIFVEFGGENGRVACPMFGRRLLGWQIVIGHIILRARAPIDQHMGHAALAHQLLGVVDGFSVVGTFEENGHSRRIQIPHPAIQIGHVAAHPHMKADFVGSEQQPLAG